MQSEIIEKLRSNPFYEQVDLVKNAGNLKDLLLIASAQSSGNKTISAILDSALFSNISKIGEEEKEVAERILYVSAQKQNISKKNLGRIARKCIEIVRNEKENGNIFWAVEALDSIAKKDDVGKETLALLSTLKSSGELVKVKLSALANRHVGESVLKKVMRDPSESEEIRDFAKRQYDLKLALRD